MHDALQNKRVLIVGGSGGLGLAVAARAGAYGAELVLASRSAGEKQPALAAALGREVVAVSMDVASESSMDAALPRIGSIDHLVLATRPAITPGPFAATDLQEAKQAFETKFWGPYRLIQKLHTRISQGGSIVLTSGIAGEKIYRNHSTMAVINSATEALCRTLAVELAPVRVNAVSPGFVAPKPPEAEIYARQFPAGRVAAPEEVADAFVSLMQNAYVTGTTLVVDGGARLL